MSLRCVDMLMTLMTNYQRLAIAIGHYLMPSFFTTFLHFSAYILHTSDVVDFQLFG